jgi:hypothetical protein
MDRRLQTLITGNGRRKGDTMRTLRTTAWMLAAAGLLAGLSGCSSGGDPNQLGNPDNTLNPGDPFTPGPGGVPGGGTAGTTPEEGPPVQLDQRKRDYGEATRVASLKLVGELPSLDEIKAIAAAPNEAEQKKVYEAYVDKLIADPRFTAKMIDFWRDTFRTAQVGNVGMNQPNKDFAANFAALVTVEGRPYTDLFTATTGTCPTYDMATNKITAADCAANNGAPTAGILTDRGIMSQYFAPMAFRRTRFIQEVFVCAQFPTEFAAKPTSMGATVYTNPWPFDSITGGTTAGIRINFKDTSAVNCANCHGTINHIAPLFANFDANGAYNATAIQVDVPVAGNPKAKLEDWLPAGQQGLAWRFGGTPVTDITGLGQQIAKDPDVAACAVTRAWNFAFSRGDVVANLATVPAVVTKAEVDAFKAGNFKFKDTLARIFKSDDFTMW